MSDKLFSTEHEVAVLSIILKNPDLVYNSCARSFMMSSTAHQLIYRQIEELSENHSIPDIQLVKSSLEASGTISNVGGKDYLEYLISQDYKRENLKKYCGLVVASYKARSLLSNVSKVRPDSITSDNVDDTIRDLKKSLDSITELSNGEGVSHIGDNLKKSYEEIIARTSSPGIRGATWGISDIDRATGGKSPGDWWIIGGRPSQGKTALLCNSILADGKAGVPVIFFAKEMNYQSMVERIISVDSGVPIQNIRLGILNKDDIELIKNSAGRINKYPIYIDNNFGSDINDIEASIYKYKSLKGVEVAYIDYLQLVSERNDNQTAELGRISRILKSVANDQNVCVIGTSQLNRGVETRDNKRPIMSDLRQSGNLEEDADFVVGLYRDDYYNRETKYKNTMEFIILKARNGPIGTIYVKFNPENNKVENK